MPYCCSKFILNKKESHFNATLFCFVQLWIYFSDSLISRSTETLSPVTALPSLSTRVNFTLLLPIGSPFISYGPHLSNVNVWPLISAITLLPSGASLVLTR